jgi:uncharacterized membrane protein YidH (DUF202 family)
MRRSAGYSLEAQLERTVLSWNRSALALGANGGLLAREGFLRDVPAVGGAGLAVVGVAAALWVLSITRYSGAYDEEAMHLIAYRERLVLMLTAFAIVLSVGDLAVAIT